MKRIPTLRHACHLFLPRRTPQTLNPGERKGGRGKREREKVRKRDLGEALSERERERERGKGIWGELAFGGGFVQP